MKTRTVTERIGELLGPVDWSYDFRSHFDNYGCSDEGKDHACEVAIDRLRKIESAPGKWLVTNYGGWPRCGLHPVVSVGMYDGWPYWRPVPAVCVSGVLGCEWYHFDSITDIYDRETHKAWRPAT